MSVLCKPKPAGCDCKCFNLAYNCPTCTQNVWSKPKYNNNPTCNGTGYGKAGVCCIPTYQPPPCKICEKVKATRPCIPLCHPCSEFYRLNESRCGKNLLLQEHLLQEKGCCGESCDPTTTPCKPNGVKYTDGCCPPPCKPCCRSLDCNPLLPCCVKILPCQPRSCPAKSCPPPPFCCPNPCDPKVDPRCCVPCQIPLHPCLRPAVPACPKIPCPLC